MVLCHTKGRLAKFRLLYSGLFFYFQAKNQTIQEESHTEGKKLPSFLLFYNMMYYHHDVNMAA